MLLKAIGRSNTAGPARQRIRSVLVAGEIALSAVLLFASVLLIQSLYRLHQERLGFRPQGLIAFSTLSRRPPERHRTVEFRA